MGQTETKVAQVTLKSENDKNKTISIDRPKDNLSLNQIKAAFAPAIQGEWLLDNYGDKIVEVAEAKYNQVIKTQINGEPAIISPASINIELSSESGSETLAISNGVFESYVLPNCSIENNAIAVSGSIENNGSSFVFTAYTPESLSSLEPFTGTLKLYVVDGSSPIIVPVSITANV